MTLLVVSNTLQSVAWARTVDDDPDEDLWHLLPGNCRSRMLMRTLLFPVAFIQLHYVVDIAARLCTGRRERDVTGGRLSREVATKCLESAPQLYFQAYVLLALGTHGEPLQAASVAISVASLTYGGDEDLLYDVSRRSGR